jgi:hypothetical protein
MRKKTYLKSKKWLNPDTSAFIFVELSREDGWYNGTLKLADCARICNFDVDLNSKKDRTKTMKKIDLMVAELIKLRLAIKEIKDD